MCSIVWMSVLDAAMGRCEDLLCGGVGLWFQGVTLASSWPGVGLVLQGLSLAQRRRIPSGVTHASALTTDPRLNWNTVTQPAARRSGQTEPGTIALI